MIKPINNFLLKGETDFLKDYWETREPSLKACGQCDKAVSSYADFTSESLLRTKQYLVEEAMGVELLPTYSFSRLYYNGSELTKHVDRPSCEVSVTLCIFADKEWPIWFHELKDVKADPNKKPISLFTKEGEAVAYEGCNYEHWRDKYDGKKCMQVFLHYVRKEGRYSSFKLDGRKFFGQQKQEAIKDIWK